MNLNPCQRQKIPDLLRAGQKWGTSPKCHFAHWPWKERDADIQNCVGKMCRVIAFNELGSQSFLQFFFLFQMSLRHRSAVSECLPWFQGATMSFLFPYSSLVKTLEMCREGIRHILTQLKGSGKKTAKFCKHPQSWHWLPTQHRVTLYPWSPLWGSCSPLITSGP